MIKRLCLAGLWLIVLGMCCFATASAEGNPSEEFDLNGIQALADEADWEINVRQMIIDLVTQSPDTRGEALLDGLKEAVGRAWREAFPSLLTLIAPAFLWALCRRMTENGTLGLSADVVCYLTEAIALTALYAERLEQARESTNRISALIEGFHPLLTAVLSASGSMNLAGLMQPIGAFAAGTLTDLMTRSVFALSGGVAVLSVAGNMGSHMKLDGLIRWAKKAAQRIMAVCSAFFLSLMTAGGLLESARDSLTLRAASYAVNHVLPVIGGDVAGSLGGVSRSISLLSGAVGVTGAAVLIGLCLMPILRTLAAEMGCLLAAALAQTAADGPICRCLEGISAALQLLLLVQISTGILFLILLGTTVGAGRL